MRLDLADRRCVVTGAGRGIGLAVVALLADEGAEVIAAGRSRERLAPALEAGAAEALELDVTAVDAGERMARAGRVDVLVNNAGTAASKALEEETDEDWERQWRLNVLGPWRLMRAVVPPMAERGWGRVVNVSSSAGKRPSSIGAAYSVTKAAELSLSRVFADAYAGRGVLVNAVAPGAATSELWVGDGGLADQRAAAADSTREEVLAAQGAKLPVGRMGTPEEIAAVIAFLCSERAAFVSGAAWSVDGGTVPGIL